MSRLSCRHHRVTQPAKSRVKSPAQRGSPMPEILTGPDGLLNSTVFVPYREQGYLRPDWSHVGLLTGRGTLPCGSL